MSPHTRHAHRLVEEALGVPRALNKPPPRARAKPKAKTKAHRFSKTSATRPHTSGSFYRRDTPSRGGGARALTTGLAGRLERSQGGPHTHQDRLTIHLRTTRGQLSERRATLEDNYDPTGEYLDVNRTLPLPLKRPSTSYLSVPERLAELKRKKKANAAVTVHTVTENFSVTDMRGAVQNLVIGSNYESNGLADVDRDPGGLEKQGGLGYSQGSALEAAYGPETERAWAQERELPLYQHYQIHSNPLHAKQLHTRRMFQVTARRDFIGLSGLSPVIIRMNINIHQSYR